jgi:hypothetical protein
MLSVLGSESQEWEKIRIPGFGRETRIGYRTSGLENGHRD